MTVPDVVRPKIDRAQRAGIITGAVGLLALVSFGFRDWGHFLQSYLFAYVFAMAFAMGSLAILQLHHMTGGRWGFPIRRILEAGSRTIPVMTVLFIPILLGIKKIYPWAANPEILGSEPVTHFRRLWLQPGFFVARAVIYFVIWNLLAYLLNKWSAEQDRTGDVRLKQRMSSLAAPGTVLWALSWSWAMFDWVMSLEPTWFSSIYGMIFMVIACLAAVSFSAIMLRMLNDYEPLRESYAPSHLNDVGNLMLAFTLLWTYMSFAQFLIIWSGNLKQEITWYKVRAYTSWGYIGAALLIFHFFIPFFILLQRRVKRRVERLSVIAAWMLVITVVDIFWIVVPAFENRKSGLHVSPQDIVAVLGLFGIWLAVFMIQLKKMPLLPLHDPRFEGVLEHSHGD